MVQEETTEVQTQEPPQGLQPPADERYFHGTGRRKSAIARVRLYPGSGKIVINGRQFTNVFHRLADQKKVKEPLLLCEKASKFNVWVKIHGGGNSAWAGAITLGIARALIRYDEAMKPVLRRGGLLTRDSRVKERKKYGLKRARKAPQFTKR